MKKLKTTLLILLFPFLLSAQHTNWESETITIEDGLRSDGVTAILKDQQGFMWFGTKMGLQRFDGYQFKTYEYNVADSVSLSENKVLDLYEASDGNLWIALNRGVDKLDPKRDRIIHYIPDPEDSASISEGEINRVFVDSQGTVWVGTTYGLDRFDPDHESFIHYKHNPNDSAGIGGNFVTCIFEDNENNLWVGTAPGGLNKMDKTSGTFQKFGINPDEPESWSNSVTCIYKDRRGNFWVGTKDGLFQFNRKESSFSRVLQKEHNPQAPKSQIFAAVYQDFDGNYWIRTNSGLYLFDSGMERIDAWEHKTLGPAWGAWENIRSIYQDSCGILWYCKHYKGIEKLIPNNKTFRFYRNNPHYESTGVNNMYVENKDVIWMPTNIGLSRLDRKKNEYQLFRHNSKNPNSISSNSVNVVFRDQKGSLWVGTCNGLDRLELSGTNTYTFTHYKDDPASISKSCISQIFQDHKGELLFIHFSGVIEFFDRDKEEFLKLEYQTGNQKIDRFGSILLEEPDKIWTAAEGKGLFEIILPFRKSNHHTILPDTIIIYKAEFGGLNAKTITCLHKDQTGTYWLGTEGGGLNKMILRNSEEKGGKVLRFEYFTKKNGLRSDDISTILEDDKGRLWLGTENGLSRFDPDTENFTNYDKTDGLKSYAFSFQGYKSPDGEMFFPSDNGLLAFYPDSIEDNPIIPPIVITDFKLFNESVRMGKKSPIQTSISGVNEITLPYNQNFLSLEFAALNYLHPEKNRYKYKMEGLDPDWITAGTRRFADYPDLKPGKYTFRVIGSNNNGGWNMEGTSLQISILPPWWATYYAYLIYGFLIVLLIIGYGRLRIRQVRKQKILLKDEVRKRTQQIEANQEEIESQKKLLEVQNRKILEANQMKTRFFNNVSHEFRTPLTLIQGPAKDLQTHAKLNKKEHGKLQMISQNAGRLLALVNQVLDIAKLDNGRMKLKLVNGDIMQSLRNIVGSFTSMAETRGILYNRFIPIGKYNTWFDFNVLEKIVVNLLSNAFKFTPEAGEITFRARWFHGETIESPDQLEFSVSDQGPGIPKNSIDKIFDRFYQIEDAGLQSSAGTGIGLSLVRDLVNLNHGKIDVKSEIGEGSTFTITLPLGKDHLTKDEYVTESEEPKFDSISVESKETVSYAFRQTQSTHKNKNETENPIVLIVEDNPDIRRYISESLEDMYQVIEAVNGDSGLIKTKKNIPDLVITDLIMPKTDGIELCREIKSDERTSHIPIIMLTAKASLDEKLTGLETGADDYLSKPFHMEELITRITNLIDQRKKLRERFSREITLEPRDISVTSLDEAFLNRAIATVESHLSDDAFDINKFQDEMHMSHSTLFRKLQALTNLSPTGFIRNIRLKRAAQLLREHYGNIAKVSYEVGFNNPAYFSKCFKSLFGMSPVDYLNKSLKEV